jgi:hypothetical protein
MFTEYRSDRRLDGFIFWLLKCFDYVVLRHRQSPFFQHQFGPLGYRSLVNVPSCEKRILRCQKCAAVSQHGERIKWQGSGEVPQSIGSLHASFLSWRHRVSQILTDCERWTARSCNGRRSSRSLVCIAGQLRTRGPKEEKRHRLVLQALHDVEAENRSLREELRRRGKPDPASWTLKQEVFARNIRSLPAEIAITRGMVSVSFTADDPVHGARLLHELSLAVVNDWATFCRPTGSLPG